MGACALGAGLGFWARPGEAGDAPHPVKAAEPQKALEIVVADAPLSPGQPLDVLPAGSGQTQPPRAAPPPVLPLEPMAPRRAASGLVRVDAPVAAAPPPPTAVALAPPKPSPDLKAAAMRAERQRQAEQARVAEQQRLAAAAEAKAEARARAAEKAQAKAEAAKKTEARLAEQRRAEARKAELRAEAAEEARQAKAEAARAAKLAKAQKAKAEAQARAAEKAEAARQARLDAAREKAREAAKAERMAALVRALKAAPKRIAAETRQLQRQRDTQLAEAARAARPTPRAAAPTPRADSPMRLAKATCASSDPGEALVCADSRLGARDRQMQEAYRSAEAAGVSPDALRRQQARWLQARAAAAREDRWAVEDVYEARISELKEQARDQQN